MDNLESMECDIKKGLKELAILIHLDDEEKTDELAKKVKDNIFCYAQNYGPKTDNYNFAMFQILKGEAYPFSD
jgi:hypothetical protein